MLTGEVSQEIDDIDINTYLFLLSIKKLTPIRLHNFESNFQTRQHTNSDKMHRYLDFF